MSVIHINKSEIARKLGISQGYVSMLLNGKRGKTKKSKRLLKEINSLIDKEIAKHKAA